MARKRAPRISDPIGPGRTYWRGHCPPALIDTPDHTSTRFRETASLYRVAAEVARTGTWAEFGVGGGASAKMLLRLLDPEGTLHLFDSWQGIPDAWTLGPEKHHNAGSWRFPASTGERLCRRDSRVSVVDGWFADTLPHPFPGQLGLVNIDCDVYSSTRDVLNGITDHVDKGTAFVFDELLGYTNYADHEWKALCEWLDATGHEIEWLAKERFAACGVLT